MNGAWKGGLCHGHVKRRQRGESMSAPLAVREAKPIDRLREAALAYAEADSDQDFARAVNNLTNASIRYTRALDAQRIVAGVARSKRRGVRGGRRPKVDRLAAQHALAQAGSIRKAAAMLGVSPQSVMRALCRAVPKPGKSEHGALHALADPNSPPEG